MRVPVSVTWPPCAAPEVSGYGMWQSGVGHVTLPTTNTPLRLMPLPRFGKGLVLCLRQRRRWGPMDASREQELDEALARMRAALGDVPEEQLLEDVAEIVERNRQARRERASTPASA